MDEDPPANSGDMGSIPGSARAHMLQSNSARVQQLLKPVHLGLCSPTNNSCTQRKPAHSNEDLVQPKQINY